MIISHARVLKIAFPILLANITVPLLGVVDTAVVGQIASPIPLAAVGMGSLIITTIFWVFGFLRMGTTGLAAQALGAEQLDEVGAILSRVVMIGFVAGLALILLQGPLFYGALLVSPASHAVESDASAYMQIRILSAPAAIAIFGITGWLIAQERTRHVLALQIWMNGVNIVLDLWFVLGLNWAVIGVAWASFLAELSGFILALWMCRALWATPYCKEWARVFDKALLWKMFSVNRDILLRTLMLQGIFVSFLMVAARFDDVALAATQVLKQLLLISFFALDGFAFAAETLVGQAFGARNRSAFRRSALITSYWAFGVAALLCALVILFGPWAIAVMTKSSDVQTTALHYLPFLYLAPFLGMPAFMLDGIFVGATASRDMRNMMAVSLSVYALAVVLLVPAFGLSGLWGALLISFVIRAFSLAWRYPALEARCA